MKNVFVLMPFGSHGEYQGGNVESNFIFDEIIKPGIIMALNTNCTIEREVNKYEGGLITSSIVQNVIMADIVIVDVSGWNPNVFLELGIRYALRNKVTIVIAQKGTVIPFDMKGYRLIFYDRFIPSEAREKIKCFIETGLSSKVISDSIVFDTFKNLTVINPGFFESQRSDKYPQKIMSWDEFLKRIEWVSQLLRSYVNEGQYVPNAILGISNGGLIVADLIGKSVFSGKNAPILSLWAQRFTRKHDYFTNEYNDAIMEKIVKCHAINQPISILLIDDHFGTGNTLKQALDYLKSKLGENTNILFIPLVSRRIDHLKIYDDYLPFKYMHNGTRIFHITENDFYKFVNTDSHYFPYLMKQVSEGLEHIDE